MRHREGAVCRAPARQIRPSLCTHPGRSAIGAAHLNRNPEQDKNVPIFALRGGYLSNGSAQVGTLARKIAMTGYRPVSEGSFLRGGVFVKSPLLNRLLWVLFLPKQEKDRGAEFQFVQKTIK